MIYKNLLTMLMIVYSYTCYESAIKCFKDMIHVQACGVPSCFETRCSELQMAARLKVDIFWHFETPKLSCAENENGENRPVQICFLRIEGQKFSTDSKCPWCLSLHEHGHPGDSIFHRRNVGRIE